MSAPMKFLGAAIIAWVGFRAVTMDAVPGPTAAGQAEAAVGGAPQAGLPPIEQLEAQAPPLPASYYPDPYADLPQQAAYQPIPRPMPIYYHYPVPAPQRLPAAPQPYYLPTPPDTISEPYHRPQDEGDRLAGVFSDLPPLPTAPANTSTQLTPPAPVAPGPDRWQLSSWALLRGRPGPQALGSGGMLGGSQAGARLTYAVDPRLALSLRSSTPIGGSRGGEVAGGVRLTPFPSIPVALTAERRQALGRYGGRSAFAMFLEGGVYGQSMPLRFELDGYAQAGVVGARSRDLFAEGGFSLTRPLLDRFTFNRHLSGQLSAGFGVWGGVQPDLYRLDAGPRLSLRVRNNLRVHLDWRQRLIGNAQPGSGPAVTLAGDF